MGGAGVAVVGGGLGAGLQRDRVLYLLRFGPGRFAVGRTLAVAHHVVLVQRVQQLKFCRMPLISILTVSVTNFTDKIL